jgi:lysozyme
MNRKTVASLIISASALIGIAVHENYRETAYIPVPGDVPTIGFGSTTNMDGTPVRLGQRTTPVAALKRLGKDVEKFEAAVKRCAPVPMYQHEFDAYVSLTYNIGEGAFCRSTLVKKLNQFDYEAACKQILRWDKFKGKPLAGLTKRRQEEYKTCIGEG